MSNDLSNKLTDSRYNQQSRGMAFIQNSDQRGTTAYVTQQQRECHAHGGTVGDMMREQAGMGSNRPISQHLLKAMAEKKEKEGRERHPIGDQVGKDDKKRSKSLFTEGSKAWQEKAKKIMLDREDYLRNQTGSQQETEYLLNKKKEGDRFSSLVQAKNRKNGDGIPKLKPIKIRPKEVDELPKEMYETINRYNRDRSNKKQNFLGQDSLGGCGHYSLLDALDVMNDPALKNHVYNQIKDNKPYTDEKHLGAVNYSKAGDDLKNKHIPIQKLIRHTAHQAIKEGIGNKKLKEYSTLPPDYQGSSTKAAAMDPQLQATTLGLDNNYIGSKYKDPKNPKAKLDYIQKNASRFRSPTLMFYQIHKDNNVKEGDNKPIEEQVLKSHIVLATDAKKRGKSHYDDKLAFVKGDRNQANTWMNKQKKTNQVEALAKLFDHVLEQKEKQFLKRKDLGLQGTIAVHNPQIGSSSTLGLTKNNDIFPKVNMNVVEPNSINQHEYYNWRKEAPDDDYQGFNSGYDQSKSLWKTSGFYPQKDNKGRYNKSVEQRVFGNMEPKPPRIPLLDKKEQNIDAAFKKMIPLVKLPRSKKNEIQTLYDNKSKQK